MVKLALTGLTASVALAVAATAQAGIITITTADGNGADSFVQLGRFPSQAHVNYGSLTDVRVKKDGTFFNGHHKTYLRFDLSGFQPGSVTDATLSLVLIDTRASSRLVDINVFGLNDGFAGGDGSLGEDWAEDLITWNNAPANDRSSLLTADVTDDAVSLGAFPQIDLAHTSVGSIFTFNSSELVDFLNKDTNGLATLILTRVQTGDLSQRFASKEHAIYAPPTLTLNASPTMTAVPEPSSLILLGMGAIPFALAIRRRRRE